VLRNILPLEERVDFLLWSAGYEHPHVGFLDGLQNQIQNFDSVVRIVALVKGVDDDGDGAEERPAILDRLEHQLAKLSRESFFKKRWTFGENLLDR